MLKTNFSSVILSFAVISLVIMVYSSACKRNKDCTANIGVVDAANAPVSGATVYIHPTSAGTNTLSAQGQTGYTDGSGAASFTFKLPAILKVDITPPAPLSGTVTSGLINLEEGKSVSKVIKVY